MKRILALLILMAGVTGTPVAAADVNPAVLITGASSGIGRQIAERFAENGYFVYAGARSKQDIDELSAIENMQGVRLDVTKQAEIDAVAARIRKEGRVLKGLVNNAGVFVYGPLIEIEESELQFIMDVNVFGPYRVTKAVAPMLINGAGRVINIGSVAGFASGTMFGPYGMTKHAMEAFTDSLAAELGKFKISVSVIEPGNFRSDIMKNLQRRSSHEGDSAPTRYQAEYDRFAAFAKPDRSQHASPKAVADAALHALTNPDPKRRYLVTPNQAETDMALRSLMRRARQLNTDHPYSLSDEQLHDLLKSAD